MAPPHRCVALMAAVAAAALLLTLDAAVATARLRNTWDAADHNILLEVPDYVEVIPFSVGEAERLNTLKVLQAFAAAMPSLGWSGDNFCSWSYVTCFDVNVSIIVSSSGVTGTLPEMPDDVDYSMVRLDQIHLFGQKSGITGTLPPSWGKLRKVQTINLAYTGISGTLPSAWSSMSSLRSVRLSFTNLVGTLPTAWCSMAAIEQIALSTTHITGTLPESGGVMSKLRLLQLQLCNLYGSLPESWAQMRSLNRLGLHNNHFCGCVPTSWLTSSTLLMGVEERHRTENCSTAEACVDTTTPVPVGSSRTTGSRVQRTKPPLTSTSGGRGRKVTPSTTKPPNTSEWTTRKMPAAPSDPQCNVPMCVWCLDGDSTLCAVCFYGYVLTDDWQCMQSPHLVEAIPFTISEAEWLNTLKVLQAFAAAMPSLGWSGDDFCSWSGVMCFNDNVSISLTRSWVTGTLPEMPDDVDYSMVKLDQISIFGQHSGITGTLPSSWGKLHNMRAMGLRFISISGTLPASWSMMAAIEQIVIFSTQVTGTLPESWARMPSIQHLNLHENYFCGCVPTSWLTSPTLLMGVEARHRTENCSTAEACVDTTTPVPVGSSRTTRSRVQRTKSL